MVIPRCLHAADARCGARTRWSAKRLVRYGQCRERLWMHRQRSRVRRSQSRRSAGCRRARHRWMDRVRRLQRQRAARSRRAIGADWARRRLRARGPSGLCDQPLRHLPTVAAGLGVRRPGLVLVPRATVSDRAIRTHRAGARSPRARLRRLSDTQSSTSASTTSTSASSRRGAEQAGLRCRCQALDRPCVVSNAARLPSPSRTLSGARAGRRQRQLLSRQTQVDYHNQARLERSLQADDQDFETQGGCPPRTSASDVHMGECDGIEDADRSDPALRDASHAEVHRLNFTETGDGGLDGRRPAFHFPLRGPAKAQNLAHIDLNAL